MQLFSVNIGFLHSGYFSVNKFCRINLFFIICLSVLQDIKIFGAIEFSAELIKFVRRA
ncbi:hypothetical protein CAEBREN_13897 [Caenorhabditis brenneri]|uniref:Uncharacterized protein n=1 Tax=Caenorhabditis brenneri TaxID=135651 RepID=G0N1L9_CAEBE|nr:hypothetical protein CAEBREN_13897 [Caenorhabditis brenneri]